MQLTIFADGVRRIQPLIVFRGKGLRIPQKERNFWNSRVTVQFQDNAWVDKNVMKYWVQHMWRPWVSLGNLPKLLVADVHCAQKTTMVLDMLKECNTTTALVPSGCTLLVQPLDIAFNAQFKQVQFISFFFCFAYCILISIYCLLAHSKSVW